MPLSHENAVMAGRLGGKANSGKKSAKTLEKEKMQEAMNKMILKKTRPLIRAGMSVALGQQFVYRIDEEKDDEGKTKKKVHVLVTDPEEIANALDQMEGMGVGGDNGEYYYITTKQPDYKAIEMLLNRPYGKPKESIDLNVDVQFSLASLAKKRDEILDGNADVTEIKKPELLPEASIVSSNGSQVIREAIATDSIVVTEAAHD